MPTRKSPDEQRDEKVALWLGAFNAIREELTMPAMRELLVTLQSTEAMRDLPLYVQLARLVSANDRAAATVAALLVQTGIKTTSIDYGDDA